MSCLFDSDVVIDFFHNKKPGVDLVRKFITKKPCISIITWLEITYGIKKREEQRGRAQEFEHFITDFAIQIIPIDKKVADYYLDTKISLEKKKCPLADFDLLIASSALAYGLTLVTRNSKHFSRIEKLSVAK